MPLLPQLQPWWRGAEQLDPGHLRGRDGDSIQVAGTSTLLDWQYTTDSVGNITLIDNLQSAQDRVFAYRDFQYFLTQGNGPWGTRSWSYDKIGNRLSETRNGVTDTYTYLLNGVSGRTPKLSQIALGGGGTKTFGYDAIGDQTSVGTASDAVDLLYDAAKRLTTIERNSGEARSDFLYDGRSFLRRATPSTPLTLFVDSFESGNVACWSTRVGAPAGGTCPAKPKSEPTYSSEGTLMHVRRAGGVEDEYVFYFAGRPVGTLTRTGSASSPQFLSADHLGTPILATSSSGSALWSGGFEPFGADWNNAQGVGMFLRFPGQWDDAAWSEGSEGTDVYYNVHRWYSKIHGRYTRPDPLSLKGSGPNLYFYAAGNPLTNTDPDGRFIPRACMPDDRAWCQQQCDRVQKRLVDCKCFGVPFCLGLLNYAVAQCNDWQKGCPPCPPPGSPVIDRVPPSPKHGNCPGDHWHYFTYDQGPPPQCICRRSRRFGGCL